MKRLIAARAPWTGRMESATYKFDVRFFRAVLGGIVAGFCCYLIIYLFLMLLWFFDHHGSGYQSNILFITSLHVGSPIIIIYLVYSKLAKRQGMLVWLRRFRSDYGQKIRFHKPLAAGVRGAILKAFKAIPIFKEHIKKSASCWVIMKFLF